MFNEIFQDSRGFENWAPHITSQVVLEEKLSSQFYSLGNLPKKIYCFIGWIYRLLRGPRSFSVFFHLRAWENKNIWTKPAYQTHAMVSYVTCANFRFA